MGKLGLIAGAGGLPVALAAFCDTVGRPLFVVRLKGFADAALEARDGLTLDMLDYERGLLALKAAGCVSICFAGGIGRPDFDAAAPGAVPADLVEARGGDDRLLSAVISRFEAEGFTVEGAHEIMTTLTLGDGPQGRHAPNARDQADMARALLVARAVGELDVGQGAVCRDGLVLAVEAQEGTDAMLERVAILCGAVRADPDKRRGVLAKASKPGQDLRIDLPAVGPTTLVKAAEAGLAGVVGEAGRVLIIDRETTLRLADDLGLFLYGAPRRP